MSKKFISITVFLTVIGLVFQGIVSGWRLFFFDILQLLFFSFLIAGLLFLLFRKGISFRERYFRTFLIFGSISGFFILLMSIFVVVSNTFPAKLSKVTMTHSGASIIYYQMSHIATPRFYESIRNDLNQYAKDGYVIYAEGVRPGTKENQDILDQSLGIKIHSDTYDQIARFIGMEAQSMTLYSGVVPSSIRQVDLSVDDIAPLLGSGGTDVSPLDVREILDETSITPLGKKMLSYFFQGVMNLVLRSGASDDIIRDRDPRLYETLLDRRNTTVIDTYMRDQPEKAIFVYGALHLDGMYDLLKKKNPHIKIEKLEAIYPYVY